LLPPLQWVLMADESPKEAELLMLEAILDTLLLMSTLLSATGDII
jgi:hypothetical protein